MFGYVENSLNLFGWKCVEYVINMGGISEYHLGTLYKSLMLSRIINAGLYNKASNVLMVYDGERLD